MRKVILLFLTLCPGAFAQSNQPTTAPDPGALQWLDAMPKDKLGFAAPEKSDDFRVVYVSASVGDDRANSGLRPQIPVRTIARACQIARNHSDDEIRLLRGDTFDPWNVHGGGMNRNGRDPWHPFIVGAYGDPHRPRPKMTTQFGISGTNVLLRDLDFTCIRRDYTKPDYKDNISYGGYSGLSEMNDYLWVEGCRFQYFIFDVQMQVKKGQPSRLVFRRNVVAFSWGGGHSGGIYIQNISDWAIDENFLWHNGWASKPLDGPATTDAPRTIFSHNAYLQQDNEPGDFSWNLSADASSHGCQQRPGGTQTNNYFFRNPYGSFVAKTPSSVSGNIYEGSDLIPNASGGDGLEVIGCTCPVTNCLFLNNPKIPGHCLIATPWIIIHDQPKKPVPDMKLTVSGCLARNWPNAAIFSRLLANQNWSGVTESNNDWAETGSYADPTRDLDAYAKSIGLENADALLAAELNQEAANWDVRLSIPTIMNWVHAGFAPR